jgi:hypothetical protein
VSRDAIVDEVRAIREDIAREYDYDLNSIFQMLRRTDKKTTKRGLREPRQRKACRDCYGAGRSHRRVVYNGSD